MQAAILLFVIDRPLLFSLHFSLTIEGFQTLDGSTPVTDPSAAGVLIIDQDYRGDGLALCFRTYDGGDTRLQQ